LHQGELVTDPEDARVVAGGRADQQIGVLPGLKLAQNLRQAVLRQFARSAGAGGVIGQTDLLGVGHETLLVT
jgi:hypothetical protein